ncbi:MAG: hypothetical protein P4L53_12290 [Candidatus Obscuribacterales bacterium]|nr:hypothetical protein [Candidatus Obscuribacterales bacterium]
MKIRKAVLIRTLVIFALFLQPTYGDDITGSEASPVTSMDALDVTQETSGRLCRSAEIALQQGHFDKAIKLCQQSLEVKDDTDLHQVYAMALEKKLATETDKDPELFKKCVQEWLLVLRQSGGEENLSFHGISIPGEGKFFGDEDRTLPAKQHLVKLTGRTPKVWETDVKFLKRVTRNMESKVSGTVLKY